MHSLIFIASARCRCHQPDISSQLLIDWYTSQHKHEGKRKKAYEKLKSGTKNPMKFNLHIEIQYLITGNKLP